MKRSIMLVCLTGLLAASSASAHPVRKMEMEYDHAQKTLHITIPHISDDVREDYVRKLTVFKNGEEVESRRYAMQNIPDELKEDVAIEAKGGDSITVKISMSEGGGYEETYSVPAAPESEEDKDKANRVVTPEYPAASSGEKKEKGY